MAVYSVGNYRVKPGCRNEFVASVKEAKSIIEPLGVNLRSIRLGVSLIEGVASGTYALRFAYDDLESWAATLAREDANPEFNEMVRKAMSPASPAEMLGRMLIQDIIEPAYRSNGSKEGTVIQRAVGRVKPGRLDDFRTMMEQQNQRVLDSGALCVRNVMVIAGGPNTGRVATVREYADMNAFAEAWTRRNEEPKWQELIHSVTGPDGPVIEETQALDVEIPL